MSTRNTPMTEEETKTLRILSLETENSTLRAENARLLAQLTESEARESAAPFDETPVTEIQKQQQAEGPHALFSMAKLRAPRRPLAFTGFKPSSFRVRAG